MKRFPVFMIVLGLAVSDVGSVQAGARTKAAQEAAEYILRKFGRKAVKEGTETLARKIEVFAARHGGDFITAVRRVGPRAIPMVSGAGEHASKAVKILARHGEKGAAWIVSRPKAMRMVLQHGDGATAHLASVVEPVLRPEEQREAFGVFYEAAKAALEAFCIQTDRETVRLCKPSRN